MDFSFKTRGGTAPELTRVYGRPNRTERSAHGKIRRQRNRMEDTDGVSGQSRAPPTLCCQRQRQRLDKGAGKTSKPRAGWQTRHAEGNRISDSMGPMPSTRPPSRQALSDLMDLNLTQKYDKIRNRDLSPRKQQQERRHAFAASATKVKNDRLGTATDSTSDTGRGHDRYWSSSSSSSSSSREQQSNVKSNRFYPTQAVHVIDDDHLEELEVGHEPPCDKRVPKGQKPLRTIASCKESSLISLSRATLIGHPDRNGGELDGDEKGNRRPCQEASTPQSERDQRMWSALKTSITSDGEVNTDTHCLGLELSIARTEISGASSLKQNDCIGVKPVEGPATCTPVKGTKNMEKGDMDGTLRPHRVASARLLESRKEFSRSNKVKYARNLSASASRPRTRQSETSGNVWVGSGGAFQLSGRHGELLLRNYGEFGYSGLSDTSEIDGLYNIAAKAGTERQRRGNDNRQAHGVDLGRFQWMTNEEDLANVLGRPPSRQKEAFPKHLADVLPYPAFQVEVPVADEQAKQHIKATRKNAVEQARPPSRHKPPERSLFLEVPETRRQIPPSFCGSRGALIAGADPYGDLTSRRSSLDTSDNEATTARDRRGTILALDRRHDNPDRDGFSVLQVQGPCPFRIEVTNSFVQPHPPKVPVDREVVYSSNRDTTASKKNATVSPGTKRAPTSAPINKACTPSFSHKMEEFDDAAEKGPCVSPFSSMGSRSTGGFALRGSSHPFSYGTKCGEVTLALDSSSPSPLTHRGGFRESGLSEVGSTCSARRLGEENVESKRWKPGDYEKVSEVAGLADTWSLRIKTGTPEHHRAEWYLESCDDNDGGAFLDVPAVSTLGLGESAGAKHDLLDTTLGQDFLSLFAPSSGRDDSSFISAFGAF